MKKDIHPNYYSDAKVKCACGNEYIIGSTLEKMEIETCSKCHPFYTGKERGAISGGRIEKFQNRAEKKGEHTKKAEKRAKRRKEPSLVKAIQPIQKETRLMRKATVGTVAAKKADGPARVQRAGGKEK